MLTAADLSVNVLEFHGRAYQFERISTVDRSEYAVFARTETESESKFRPKLVHLTVVVPLAWIHLDPATDDLRISRESGGLPMVPAEPVVEVGAERPEFRDGGIVWRRAEWSAGALVYAPTDLLDRLLAPAGRTALGLE